MTESREGRPEILERRYQRLLAWYPPRHRAAHGDEMLGVLLAAAPEGQRRPRLAEGANLLWGALLIWLRPRPAEQTAAGWSDALAAFSVAAPLALLLQDLVGMATSGIGIADRGGFTYVLISLAFSGLGLAVPFVLLGLRRAGGFICAAAALLLVYVAGHAIYSALFTAVIGTSFLAIPLFAYATEAGALLGSPGPRRGWRVPGWPGWLVILVAAGAAGVLEGAVIRVNSVDSGYDRFVHHQPPPAPWLAVAVVSGAVLAVLVAAVASRSALARRLVALFAITAYPWLVSRVWTGPASPVASTLVTYIPPLILAAVVVAVARRERRSARGADRPARA
jgi:hypothetical protein